MKKCVFGVVSVFLVASLLLTASATIYFKDDFENGSLNKWTGTTGTVPTVVSHDGNMVLLAQTWVSYAYKFIPEGIPDAYIYADVEFSATPQLYQQDGFMQIKDVDDINTLLFGIHNNDEYGVEWFVWANTANGTDNLYETGVYGVVNGSVNSVQMRRNNIANFFEVWLGDVLIMNQTQFFEKDAAYFEFGCTYCDSDGWTGNFIDNTTVSSEFVVPAVSTPTPTPTTSSTHPPTVTSTPTPTSELPANPTTQPTAKPTAKQTINPTVKPTLTVTPTPTMGQLTTTPTYKPTTQDITFYVVMDGVIVVLCFVLLLRNNEKKHCPINR